MSGGPLAQPSRRFSVAVSGAGQLREPFIALLRAAYRNVKVYDRIAEATRDDAAYPMPRHPRVADVEAVFGSRDGFDQAYLRGPAGHRYFSFQPRNPGAGATGRFLRRVADCLTELL